MPTPTKTFEFAERLAQDEQFRARVTSDPEAALLEHGLAAEPGLIPKRVELPPRDEVLKMFGVRSEEPEPEPQPPPPEPDIIGPPHNLGLQRAKH